MPYTLWSHEQLLGESDFELARSGRRRAGAFRPTPLGATLLPTLCGMGPAVLSVGKALGHRVGEWNPEAVSSGEFERMVHDSPEGQELLSFVKRICELELEIRDPAGTVLDVESLAVNDMQMLLALCGADADDEAEASAGPSEQADGGGAPRLSVPPRPADAPRYIMSATMRRRSWNPLARSRSQVH